MDVFGHIDVLINDRYDPILLVGNSARSGQAMHDSVLAVKKVYL